MTDRKDKTIARDRNDAARSQSGQAPVGSKVAEMAAFTAAAGGLALGAIDMARADDDAFENSVFDRILRNEPDEAFATLETEQQPVETQLTEAGAAQAPFATASGQPAAAIDAPATDESMLSAINGADEADLAKFAPAAEPVPTARPVNTVLASNGGDETLASGDALVSGRLVEDIATQISSGIERVFDGIASGAIQQGFAQELAEDIVSNVRSILDEALPATADLASSIRADVAETLGDVGDGMEALLSSPADTLDQLTGRLDDLLPDAGVVSIDGTAIDGLGSTTDALASLPSSILGGSDGAPGALGRLFYDDGDAPSDALEHSAGSAMEFATATASAVPANIPLDLGFIGQSDFGDVAAVTGFSGNSNPLHLL